MVHRLRAGMLWHVDCNLLVRPRYDGDESQIKTLANRCEQRSLHIKRGTDLPLVWNAWLRNSGAGGTGTERATRFF